MKDGKVLRVRSRADRVENLMNLVSSKSEARLPSI